MNNVKIKQDEYKIAAVDVERIDDVFYLVADIIKRATDRSSGEIRVGDVYRNLMEGDMLLVLIYKDNVIVAVNVLQIVTFDSGIKAMCIPITAGDDLDMWLDPFLEVAKNLAIQFGCDRLRGMSVRKGWMKKLKDRGWNELHTVIECNIEDRS